MSIPSGITTCTVYINAPVSFIGAPGRVHLTITPSEQLVHAATGTPLVNFVDTIAPAEGASATIVLPHTDQPGFLDDSGAAYTNWYYTADVKYEKDGQFFQFPQRTFQIATGQDELDLALVQSGQPATPVTAPTADVLSVNGKTGIVVLDKADAQLDQVDNTSDANKPVSTAQQAALDTKEPVITPADVAKYYRGDKTWATLDKTAAGLGNVNNTSDANKPVSTAQQTALDAKAPLASPAFTGTVTGISKSMVGLGNADNTSDANKPVSTAQQTALNAKVDTASKGAANGVASLGADSKVISTQIPDLSGSYVALGQRGAANGVASLGADSKVIPTQIPDLSGTYTTPAAVAAKYLNRTALRARLEMAGLITEKSPGVPLSGILDPGAVTDLVTARTDWAYDVIPATHVTVKAPNDGVWLSTVGATTTVQTDPAPASNSRIDIIYSLQHDTNSGDPDDLLVLGVAKGVPAASPVAPSVPAGALWLAQARIYSGTTGTNNGANTLGAQWAYTSLRGNPVKVRNSAERDTRFPTPYQGAKVERLDLNNVVETYLSGAWVQSVEKGAKGLVYHVAATAVSGSFVAWTVINNFASFTFKAGRNYRIVWDGHHQSSVDSDHVDMQIASAAVADAAGSVTGLTVLRQKTFDCHGANAINVHILEARVTYPVDTTLQIKFVAQRATGSGNIIMVGSTLDTMYYQIFDDGAQI